jgi:hypothetical protein
LAAELQTDHVTGKTVVFLIRNASAQIWNTATLAFEAYNSTNIANYGTASTEQGTSSGFYVGNFPTGITTPGTYFIIAKLQAGGSLVEADISIGWQNFQWGGSSILDTAAILTQDVDALAPSAAKQSLVAGMLKLCSQFDALTGKTYRKDGTTVFMTQTPTVNSAMTPIQKLAVGS